MLTSEDIKLLSQLMDEKLKPINERFAFGFLAFLALAVIDHSKEGK